MNARALLNPAFMAAFLVMAGAAIAMDAGIRAYGFYLRKKEINAPEGLLLRAIPPETRNWRRVGGDEDMSAETLEVLGTSNYISRVYARKTPDAGAPPAMVQLHIAYYTGMIDTVPHVPERCFTAAGVDLTGGPFIVDVPLDSRGWNRHPDANPDEIGRIYSVRLDNTYSAAGGQRVRLPRDLTPGSPLRLRISEYTGAGGAKMYAGYFFVANGGWVDSAEQVRLLAFNLTDDYAYYLKVQFTSTGVGSPEELAAQAGSLLDDLFGEIMRCVPDWTEVQAGRYPPDHPRRAPPQARP